MPPTPVHPGQPASLRRMASPLGRIELAGDGVAVTRLTIERDGRLPSDGEDERSDAVLDAAAEQLAEYFAGARRDFDVPVALPGTEFQRDVWARLQAIPFGEVVGYGKLGRATGRATAGRAVGGAVGANPVPILVPCHRVLASDGRITGYSAGEGIATKRWLLDLEGALELKAEPRRGSAAAPAPTAARPSGRDHD